MIDKQMERENSNSSEEMADLYKSLPAKNNENNNGDLVHIPYSPLDPSSKFSFATNLRCITEKTECQLEQEKDLTEDVFKRSESNTSTYTSSLISSPSTPYSMRTFSQLSCDSIDDAEPEPDQPISQDVDILAARRGSMRSRRSGFAFHFGDQAVPANAFVNTEVDSQAPKMLSITEMMMKIGPDKKHSDTNSPLPAKESSPKNFGYPAMDPKRKESLRKAGAGPQRFSLIGLRKVSSSEVEEDLGFLHCLGDQGLQLSLYEQLALLWFDRKGRFVAGLMVGVALAVFLRLLLAITHFINRS